MTVNINFLLFNGFETLDLFGPVEILAHFESHQLRYFSLTGGLITSTQGVSIMTEPIDAMPQSGILVLPGGFGTRTLVYHDAFIAVLKHYAEHSEYCLTICTGSALLAKTGLLDGRRATSNKKAFDWVTSVSNGPHWIRKARWTADGKFYTSSGVSAGMDMSLGFISDLYGAEKAVTIAEAIEYRWNRDPDDDAF
ncbi:DJ-1/PfpI family protein [Acidaminobacter sp.]|uniref:DJ-1/PfpI family protein n=1 Tax=Acidaminobacter sp. TaxID=1872102 RepID=UPI0025BBDACC|nr:DJ-1/PfpI family protein [Acidaminobacter sp.]